MIPGHMMTADNPTTHAVNDRIMKSNNARVAIRNSCISNINIPIERRLILFHAIIGSILLDSLHCVNI